MPYFYQIADNLRNKYLQLRAMEKRSDEMLKQIIDTFYLMEGLNRLQADLDCLDVLIKNNTFLERVLQFKTNTKEKNSTTSRKSKLRVYLDRGIKTITSLSLYKQLVKKEPQNHIESAFDHLKKITCTQHVKISELMEMVQHTIVTNCEVLEQLQLISGIPTKNLEPLTKVRFMTDSTGLTSQNDSQESNESLRKNEEHQNADLKNLEVNNDVIDARTSKSRDSITTLCKDTQSMNWQSANMLFFRPNRMFRKHRQENMAVCDKGLTEVESAIGDGQTGESFELKDYCSVSSKSKGNAICPCKSGESFALNNQVKGDFVETKFENGMEICKDTLKKIIDSESA